MFDYLDNDFFYQLFIHFVLKNKKTVIRTKIRYEVPSQNWLSIGSERITPKLKAAVNIM